MRTFFKNRPQGKAVVDCIDKYRTLEYKAVLPLLPAEGAPLFCFLLRLD
jgi:hypothetical protein